jgi:selenocysteine lyase/cysteine desulfurase
MGTKNIIEREEEQLEILWDGLKEIPNLHLLAENQPKRLGVISFYIDDLHYNLGVRLLNDKYGIQVRGGCSCAGTYGHYLLHVDHETSDQITESISHGDLSAKPGWIRMSIHPTMNDGEIEYLLSAVKEMAENFEEWSEDYEYSSKTNEYAFKKAEVAKELEENIFSLFETPLV